MKLKNLLTEDKILKECLGDSYSSFSIMERREILDVANELRPLFEELSNSINSDTQLLNEFYGLSCGDYSKILEEGLFDRTKAKVAGAVQGGKQIAKNLSGQESTDPKAAAKLKMINTRLNSFKKGVGTATAQYKKDMDKMGDNPLLQKLFKYVEAELKKGPTQVEIKDKSILGQAGELGGKAADAARQKAAEKLMPIIQKATTKIGDKMEALYQKSGPMKNFDEKYKQIVERFKKANPGMAEAMNKFSKVAIKHKGKATFIAGSMVALLTAAGATGPAAPIVMGIGMRGIYGMLAGEPPAKAFGKAAITALVGKLVGGGIKEFFGSIFDGMSVPGAEDAIGGDGIYSGELNMNISDEDFSKMFNSEFVKSGGGYDAEFFNENPEIKKWMMGSLNSGNDDFGLIVKSFSADDLGFMSEKGISPSQARIFLNMASDSNGEYSPSYLMKASLKIDDITSGGNINQNKLNTYMDYISSQSNGNQLPNIDDIADKINSGEISDKEINSSMRDGRNMMQPDTKGDDLSKNSTEVGGSNTSQPDLSEKQLQRMSRTFGDVSKLDPKVQEYLADQDMSRSSGAVFQNIMKTMSPEEQLKLANSGYDMDSAFTTGMKMTNGESTKAALEWVKNDIARELG